MKFNLKLSVGAEPPLTGRETKAKKLGSSPADVVVKTIIVIVCACVTVLCECTERDKVLPHGYL